jgi:uncharacterized protein YbaR (Trm112 family)
MFCPQCGGEYREGFTQCADCEVPLVAEPPAPLAKESETDLVTVFATANPAEFKEALGRLRGARIPHAWGTGGESPYAWVPGARMSVERIEAGTISVNPRFRERAELWLTGVAENVEAFERELERHGFAAGEGRLEMEDVLYCPRCGSMHRGLRVCVDCGVPLVTTPPPHPEAEPVPVFATLEVDTLAKARRLLRQAGIPFDWGRLGAEGGDPPPNPLVLPGVIHVPASRWDEARELLAGLEPPSHEAPDEDDEDDEDDEENEELEESAQGAPPQGWEDSEEADDESAVLYCPRCGGEYRRVASRCADCGVPLVAHPPARAAQARDRSLAEIDPKPEPEEMERCAACGEPLPEPGAFCRHCSAGEEDEGDEENEENEERQDEGEE